jgi:hypothetical protein
MAYHLGGYGVSNPLELGEPRLAAEQEKAARLDSMVSAMRGDQFFLDELEPMSDSWLIAKLHNKNCQKTP